MNEHAPQCTSSEFKITHDHVKNTTHQGLSQGIFKKSTLKVGTAKAGIHLVSYRDTNTANALTF